MSFWRDEFEPIAENFGLPVRTIQHVVFPIFWRRAVVRCGAERLSAHPASSLDFGEQPIVAIERRGRRQAAFSTHVVFELPATVPLEAIATSSRPMWPWRIPTEHLALLQTAAAAFAAHRPDVNRDRTSATWSYAIECCERALDAAIATWLDGMALDVRSRVEAGLASWSCCQDRDDLFSLVMRAHAEHDVYYDELVAAAAHRPPQHLAASADPRRRGVTERWIAIVDDSLTAAAPTVDDVGAWLKPGHSCRLDSHRELLESHRQCLETAAATRLDI